MAFCSASLRAMTTWIFDLDDTLHDSSAGVFPHINRMMTAFMVRHLALDPAEAQHLRQLYWRRYGATLTGLVRHHGVDPHHFLHETHALDELASLLVADPTVGRVLARLPGDKVLFSNGPSHYVGAVLAAMGVHRHFSARFGVDQLDFIPKPYPATFRKVLHRVRAHPRDCVMIEDSLANLRTAKRLGMRTVWMAPGRVKKPGYVDARIDRLADLLRL